MSWTSPRTRRGPVLLTEPHQLHPAAAGLLCDHDTVGRLFAYGGTAAIGPGTLTSAAQRLRGIGC